MRLLASHSAAFYRKRGGRVRGRCGLWLRERKDGRTERPKDQHTSRHLEPTPPSRAQRGTRSTRSETAEKVPRCARDEGPVCWSFRLSVLPSSQLELRPQFQHPVRREVEKRRSRLGVPGHHDEQQLPPV